jgi:hypothetical protein
MSYLVPTLSRIYKNGPLRNISSKINKRSSKNQRNSILALGMNFEENTDLVPEVYKFTQLVLEKLL